MLNKESQIAVIGAGAIGGVTAAYIQQAGYNLEVACKDRELAERLNNQGVHISGIRGEYWVKLKAVTNISDFSEPKDLILLATKANDCEAAAKDLDPYLTPDSLVVSFQNGICEYALSDTIGYDRVVGCTVGWAASQHAPGELEITSVGEFVIGNMEKKTDDRLLPIQHILNLVNPTRISENIIGELYSKLIVNACITSLGVIGGVKFGRLLADGDVRKVFYAIMHEALTVADAMKISVEPGGGGKLDFYRLLEGDGIFDDIKRYLTLRIIGFKYRNIESSSLQSIRRGEPTEIEFLNGYICDCGRKYDVPTPVNNAVRAMVLEIEAGQRPITLDNVNELVLNLGL